jgi:hypothetical protein
MVADWRTVFSKSTRRKLIINVNIHFLIKFPEVGKTHQFVRNLVLW